MCWKEDTEEYFVKNNMDSEDSRVYLEETTETSKHAPWGDAGPNVFRTAQKVRKQFTITHDRKEWKKIRLDCRKKTVHIYTMWQFANSHNARQNTSSK